MAEIGFRLEALTLGEVGSRLSAILNAKRVVADILYVVEEFIQDDIRRRYK